MNKKPTIYVIILNYLNYVDTINLIKNLKQQNEIEIVFIIIDNNSPNDSFNILHTKFKNERDIKIIKSGKNGGYGSGNNIGLRYIEIFNPDYVAILNNDIYIEDNLLFRKLIDELDQHQNAYFCAPSMMVNGKRLNNAWKVPSIYISILLSLKYSQKLFYPLTQYKFEGLKTEKVECVPGSFFISKYSKFKEIGFFDEKVFLFEEETILGFLVKKAGGYNILCRELTYDHFLSKSVNLFHGRLSKIRLGQVSQEYFGKYYRKDSGFSHCFLKILHRIRLAEEKILDSIITQKKKLF